MGWDGLLLLNILHNNQLKELGDTNNNAMVENVGFSFCLLIIMKLNYVQISINRTDFVTKHKLSPVNLTWLFQVYGKMFFFPIG